MNKNDLILVAGAGGFIGGHLVADLLRRGHTNIRAVDIKPLDEWYQVLDVENVRADLKEREFCWHACRDAVEVYNLAADMGGMGFIENNKALCMLSVLTSTHVLMAAREAGVDRFFYSSSACVYAADKQTDADVVPLREEDAYPALPEDATAGRSSSASGWPGTSGRTTVSLPESGVTTMSTVRTEPGRAAGRRPRLRFAARSPRRSSQASMRSRFGATASRRAASCMSMIA